MYQRLHKMHANEYKHILKWYYGDDRREVHGGGGYSLLLESKDLLKLPASRW